MPIAALQGAHIHPHHGVFSPVRGEYIALVAQAPLPAALAQCPRAFDIGVGTGVLSAVLARRGIAQVVATDVSPAALACAADNLQRLGLAAQVQLQCTDLFPEGQAALVVCNPPWLPGRPNSVLEQAVYDEDSGMLRGFLAGLAAHLADGGEGWLILSDLAEHLGLRTREQLLGWVAQAGLVVLGRLDTRPQHRKAHDARASEFGKGIECSAHRATREKHIVDQYDRLTVDIHRNVSFRRCTRWVLHQIVAVHGDVKRTYVDVVRGIDGLENCRNALGKINTASRDTEEDEIRGAFIALKNLVRDTSKRARDVSRLQQCCSHSDPLPRLSGRT